MGIGSTWSFGLEPSQILPIASALPHDWFKWILPSSGEIGRKGNEKLGHGSLWPGGGWWMDLGRNWRGARLETEALRRTMRRCNDVGPCRGTGPEFYFGCVMTMISQYGDVRNIAWYACICLYCCPPPPWSTSIIRTNHLRDVPGSTQFCKLASPEVHSELSYSNLLFYWWEG